MVEIFSMLASPTSAYSRDTYKCGHSQESQHGLSKITNEVKMIGGGVFTQLSRVAQAEAQSLF